MAVRRTVLVGAAGAFVVVAGVALALSLTTFGERDAGSSAPPQSAVDPAHAVTAQVRTLLVSAAMPDPPSPVFFCMPSFGRVRCRLAEYRQRS